MRAYLTLGIGAGLHTADDVRAERSMLGLKLTGASCCCACLRLRLPQVHSNGCLAWHPLTWLAAFFALVGVARCCDQRLTTKMALNPHGGTPWGQSCSMSTTRLRGIWWPACVRRPDEDTAPAGLRHRRGHRHHDLQRPRRRSPEPRRQRPERAEGARGSFPCAPESVAAVHRLCRQTCPRVLMLQVT